MSPAWKSTSVVLGERRDLLHVGIDAREGVPPLELGDREVAPPPLLRELGLAQLEAPQAIEQLR